MKRSSTNITVLNSTRTIAGQSRSMHTNSKQGTILVKDSRRSFNQGGATVEGAVGFGIGYDAVNSNKDRKIPMGRVLAEDWELRQLPRRQLQTNIRDLNRNFS